VLEALVCGERGEYRVDRWHSDSESDGDKDNCVGMDHVVTTCPKILESLFVDEEQYDFSHSPSFFPVPVPLPNHSRRHPAGATSRNEVDTAPHSSDAVSLTVSPSFDAAFM
jgi:hypothetical protein